MLRRCYIFLLEPYVMTVIISLKSKGLFSIGRTDRLSVLQRQ